MLEIPAGDSRKKYWTIALNCGIQLLPRLLGSYTYYGSALLAARNHVTDKYKACLIWNSFDKILMRFVFLPDPEGVENAKRLMGVT